MLTILPINFTGIKTLPKTKCATSVKLQKLNQDIFQKSISFKGNTNFENWMSQNGLGFEDIQGIISEKENILGSGNSNTAFAIPNCEEYCLRVFSDDIESIKNADFSNAKFIDVEDKNLRVNVGQTVGKIVVERDIPFPYQIEVLKKQTGESIGVQPPETLVTGDFYSVAKKDVAPYEDITRKEKYARTIHEVAKLPVESFEKLIQDFNEAQKAGYRFDYLNSNNLLVDSENEKINLIDMEQGAPCDLSGLFYALTNSQYFRTFNDEWYNPVSSEMRNQAMEDNIIIIRKFIQALKNQGIKLEKYKAPYEAMNSLYSGFPFWVVLRATSAEDVWNKLERIGVAE